MAHKTIRVLPRDDGADFQQSWKVEVDGRIKDNSTTKQAAKSAARRLASDGDTLYVHKTDGKIQSGYPRTVRKASAGDSDDQESGFGFPGFDGGNHGEGTFETGIGDAFE